MIDDGRERDAGFAVIAMGKLGGDELNFASDVDVIYVYTSDRGAAGSPARRLHRPRNRRGDERACFRAATHAV